MRGNNRCHHGDGFSAIHVLIKQLWGMVWCRGRWEEKPNGGGKTKEEKNIERAWQQNSFTGEGLCYEYYREGFYIDRCLFMYRSLLGFLFFLFK